MSEKARNALLYLNGVTVSFDGFRALNELSLVIEPGEMRAIIGPNGAGKTTMMDVVTGRTRPDAGEVYFDGAVDLTRLDEAAIAGLGIGRKFQKPTVFDQHTVFDNVELALAGNRGPFAAAFRPSTREASGADRGDPRNRAPLRPPPRPRRLSEPRPEAVAGDRHAARPGTEAPAGRRARGRHDRRRDRGDGASCSSGLRARNRWWSSSTTWPSSAPST